MSLTDFLTDFLTLKWVQWAGSTGSPTKAHAVRVGQMKPVCGCLSWVPSHAIELSGKPAERWCCKHCLRLLGQGMGQVKK